MRGRCRRDVPPWGTKLRLCRWECDSHFSFVLSKEKSPPQRWKRKALWDELTGGAVISPIRGNDRYALPAKSRSLLPAAPQFSISTKCSPAFGGADDDWGVLLAPQSSLLYRHGVPSRISSAPCPCHAGNIGLLRRTVKNPFPQTCPCASLEKHFFFSTVHGAFSF